MHRFVAVLIAAFLFCAAITVISLAPALPPIDGLLFLTMMVRIMIGMVGLILGCFGAIVLYEEFYEG